MRFLLTGKLLVLGLMSCGSVGCVSFSKNAATPAPKPTSVASATRPVNELTNGESARVCLATADGLEKGGKNMEAIALYEKARQLDPKQNLIAARRLAELYDHAGMVEKSKQEYAKVLDKTPNDPDLLNNLGYGCYARGEWKEAEKHLRLAVVQNPKHARAWMNLGLTLGQQGANEEALQAFEHVVCPSEALCNLAFLQMTQGKRDDAIQTYRRALMLQPDLALARAALSKLEQGDADPSPPPPAKNTRADTRPTRPAAARTSAATTATTTHVPGPPSLPVAHIPGSALTD